MSKRTNHTIFCFRNAWRYGPDPACHTCGKPVKVGQLIVSTHNSRFGSLKARHEECYERLFQ